MNINALLLLIAAGLGAIYFFFQPITIKRVEQKKEMPSIELKEFTLYEFDTTKLVDLASGSKALRYENRYELYDFVFNDNTDSMLVTLSADFGEYKNDIITLSGHVLYTTSDDMEFKTEHVLYDRYKGFAKTTLPYEARMGQNRVTGNYLYYDIKNDIIKSKEVDAIYKIKSRQDKK